MISRFLLDKGVIMSLMIKRFFILIVLVSFLSPRSALAWSPPGDILDKIKIPKIDSSIIESILTPAPTSTPIPTPTLTPAPTASPTPAPTATPAVPSASTSVTPTLNPEGATPIGAAASPAEEGPPLATPTPLVAKTPNAWQFATIGLISAAAGALFVALFRKKEE